MAERSFHPKAVLYSIYTILFLSNLYVLVVMLPILSILILDIAVLNLVAVFIPLAAGIIVSEFVSGFKLLKTGVIGSVFLSVSSALGVVSNKFLISVGRQFAERATEGPYQQAALSDAQSFSGILGNFDSAGVNVPLVFFISFLGYNLPLSYRLLKDDSVEKKYILGYIIIPVAVFAVLYLVLKSLSLFGSAP